VRAHFLILISLLAASQSVGTVRFSDEPSSDIPVRIIVTDLKGKPVAGLSSTDIEIFEGDRQQAVKSFAALRTVPRTFGIFLDEYHVSENAAARAIESLIEFVDRLRPDDVVFVMRPLDQASQLAPVAGRDDLRAAIRKFAGRRGNYAPRDAFEAEYLSAAPPNAERQRAQIIRAAMQALATAMSKTTASMPRAMIVVSEGFPQEDRGRERLATLRSVARAARTGNVAVYIVDPSDRASGPSAFGDDWKSVTDVTGGLLSTDGLVKPALQRVSADLDASYQITIGKPETEDGTYHKLDVRLKRTGVTARAPSGYWAPIAAERMMPPTRPAMSTFLKTPHVSGLIQPWFRMTRADAGRTRVTFSWMSKPGRPAASRVALSAVTFEGKKLGEAEVVSQGTAGAARAEFESVPGPIQVTMGIVGAGGKLLDTEVRYVDVPALDRADALIAAVEVVRTRTLREFLDRQLIADVMPAETKEFDRQDRLIVRVRAFSRGNDSPLVTARLLNPLGQPMRELTPLPSVDGIPQFDLPLASYAKGDYRIEIRATSGNASTSQLLMFRLIG
jgi:VWFA-related protein